MKNILKTKNPVSKSLLVIAKEFIISVLIALVPMVLFILFNSISSPLYLALALSDGILSFVSSVLLFALFFSFAIFFPLILSLHELIRCFKGSVAGTYYPPFYDLFVFVFFVGDAPLYLSFMKNAYEFTFSGLDILLHIHYFKGQVHTVNISYAIVMLVAAFIALLFLSFKKPDKPAPFFTGLALSGLYLGIIFAFWSSKHILSYLMTFGFGSEKWFAPIAFLALTARLIVKDIRASIKNPEEKNSAPLKGIDRYLENPILRPILALIPVIPFIIHLSAS